MRNKGRAGKWGALRYLCGGGLDVPVIDRLSGLGDRAGKPPKAFCQSRHRVLLQVVDGRCPVVLSSLLRRGHVAKPGVLASQAVAMAPP